MVSARPAVAPYLFANNGHEEFSPVRCATMFEQENALPGSELHLAIDNRHGLAGARQDHADMRRHIIPARDGRRILPDHVAQSDRRFP